LIKIKEEKGKKHPTIESAKKKRWCNGIACNYETYISQGKKRENRE